MKKSAPSGGTHLAAAALWVVSQNSRGSEHSLQRQNHDSSGHQAPQARALGCYHHDFAAAAFHAAAAQRVAHDDEGRREDQQRHRGKTRRYRTYFEQAEAREMLAEEAEAARARP